MSARAEIGIFPESPRKVSLTMFPSLKIAKVFGINLFIHWTFWLLPLWIVFFGHESGIVSLWMHLLLIAALFGCIVLHELGHALTARHFGIRTRRITLSPLGGIAQLERMSHQPWEEFCIAIAGPLVNVAIAGVLGAALFAGYALDAQILETLPGIFVSILLLLNIGMVVFNMIPAFPMDGGRVLRAILASSMGLLRGTRVAVTVGTVFAALIGLLGVLVLHNPWMLLIGLFVMWAGHQELQALEMEERARQAEEEEAVVVPPSGRPGTGMHVTVRVWDPVRGAWVRRTYRE
jgi:Zn-dependent protease